jgi:hypothetical protein
MCDVTFIVRLITFVPKSHLKSIALQNAEYARFLNHYL